MLPLGKFQIKVRYNRDERSTTVQILPKEDNDNVIGEATTRCSLNDQFDYKKGRKIALGRALLDAQVDKADRAQVWSDYLNKSYIQVRTNVTV